MTFQTGARATRQSGNGTISGLGLSPTGQDETIPLSSDAAYFVQWNNALTWGRFFAGVDAFYHRDPIAITITQQGLAPRKRETVSLQHVHVGYRVGAANGRPVEVYGYMRSALENNDAPYSSRYSYYGIGLRMQCAK